MENVIRKIIIGSAIENADECGRQIECGLKPDQMWIKVT